MVTSKLKTRIHFNRINMQRGKKEVWTAHTSKACYMSEKIQVIHDGVVVLETVFNPKGRQPRAYLAAKARVSIRNGVTTVEV
jgi:hypothetical protein